MKNVQPRPARHAGVGVASVVFLAAVLGSGVQAQDVYRCETGGKVSYSHEPCVGATVVDTTPTQGLDKSTGVTKKGRDVLREQQRKAFHDALRPLTGKSHAEMKVVERRRELPANVQLECQRLDARLPVEAADVKAADALNREKAEAQLFLSRSRFRNLGC